MPAWLTALIAAIVGEVFRQLMLNLPAIVVAVRQANSDTLADSKPDPALTEALREEQSKAVAGDILPPAGVR